MIDEAAKNGQPLVIRKSGLPATELPMRKRPESLFGAMKDRVKIQGDIVSPLDNEWEANR